LEKNEELKKEIIELLKELREAIRRTKREKSKQ